MSLPVVLPGSCCPVPSFAHAEPSNRQRPRGLWCSRTAGAASGQALPGRPLLSLGMLQLLLGGSMVALSYGALSLSRSAPVRNSCPFWAGSSVILSGIVGLMTWRRPMLLMVNVFVLLSAVCVLLNLAAFILCCQGAQLVSNMSSCQQMGEMCYCCSFTPSSKCSEDKILELQPAHSCTAVRILLKKMLFARCALNALTTAVCLMAAALRYLRVFTSRTPCLDEPRRPVEEDEPALEPDPDEFVPPAPPPSYFSTFYSYTPRLARRMLRDSVIPLPHIYGARIKGVEVFCPLDPPPPYEEVATQGPDGALSIDLAAGGAGSSDAVSGEELRQAGSPEQPPSTGPLEQLPGPEPLDQLSSPEPVQKARLSRCSSDPLLTDNHTGVCSSDPPTVPHTMDSSTQTSQPTLATQVTLRRGSSLRRPRPSSSMVDYQSYRHTQLLVQRILEQPAQGLAPELQELVDSIRTVLQSDQEHMDEAVRSACFMEQVITDSERKSSERPLPSSSPQTFPRRPRRRTAVLHLQSCGDLSSVACQSLDSVKQPGAQSKSLSRAEQLEQRHSLVGVFRETVL